MLNEDDGFEDFPSPPAMENYCSPSPPPDLFEGMSESSQCPTCYERQIANQLPYDYSLCAHCYSRLLEAATINQDKLRCPLCRGPLQVALVSSFVVISVPGRGFIYVYDGFIDDGNLTREGHWAEELGCMTRVIPIAPSTILMRVS